MKLMIASDIHGSEYYCRQMLDAFAREGAERLLLLGDLLYHGPRNDLPRDYAPRAVFEMLNSVGDRLLCVRGNCDAEVDQMVLRFPILADYCILYAGSIMIYATHGHLFRDGEEPPLRKGDILLQGHTHVPECTETGVCLRLNPGSVSIPKGGSPHGYMLLTDRDFQWKTLEGTLYRQFPLAGNTHRCPLE